MNYDKCYFDNDLRVYYYNFNEKDKIGEQKLPQQSKYESYYRIIWMTGISSIYIDKNIYNFSDPIICIAPPNEPLSWLSRKSPYEFIIIEIHPKFFSNYPKNDKILKFFYKLKGENQVFNLLNPKNNNLNIMIELLKTSLFARSGRYHIETRVNAIISEMCMIYESEYTEYIESTDSIPAQIIDFINKNYTNNITLETISEKFFVSKPTILAVVKRITGFAFKKYLTKLRLETALKMLEVGDNTAHEIALLCGFNGYSAFYKAFKMNYGCSPNLIKKNKNQSFPLK